MRKSGRYYGRHISERAYSHRAYLFSGRRLSESAQHWFGTALKSAGIPYFKVQDRHLRAARRRTINYAALTKQETDEHPVSFSFDTAGCFERSMPCHMTYTNTKTHKIIRAGFKMVALYTGKIKSTGVRYCPSIETRS